MDRAKDYVELHDQVQTSITLLDSLEQFLSTFQGDLLAVSGQISTLQERSTQIENRLKARKRIEKPLSSLLSELCIPPALASLILDTDVAEPWLTAIPDFEQRLLTANARKRVKAARDLSQLAEGLRIAAATKIRGFFLSLLQPLRTSMTTNMQVLQTAVLIKYRPLYAFLQSQAADVATEFQRAYVAAARVYYETGFRRYTRSLGVVKARNVEKFEPITTVTNDHSPELHVDEIRLAYARLEGPSVTMGYMADEKSHKEPMEALFRSALLVLLDNATAEYTFISTFFAPVPVPPDLHPSDSSGPLPSPAHTIVDTRRPSVNSNLQDVAEDNDENETAGHGYGPGRRDSVVSSAVFAMKQSRSKEELAATAGIWKQVMEPALTYSQTFSLSTLDPPPPLTHLLTMIRLTESVLEEVQHRECPPLESWLFGIRMQLWPVFQKLISEHVANLSKLNEAAAGGYFKRTSTVSDAAVRSITNKYISIFSSFIILTAQHEETMIFQNLQKLRHELTQLILNQSKKTADPLKSATYQSSMFESLLQAMTKGPHPLVHPKAQAELAYWREREEESRRRLTSGLSRNNR